jgi:multisubunit Na+/H+ antiporter MnhC subunit
VAGLIQPYVGVALYFLIGVYLFLPVNTVRKLLGRGKS